MMTNDQQKNARNRVRSIGGGFVGSVGGAGWGHLVAIRSGCAERIGSHPSRSPRSALQNDQ